MQGKLILFEGCEFVGKSTQVKMLASRLKELGYPVVVTKEPGGTDEGRVLRKKLLEEKNMPDQELSLFLKDRTIHFAKVVIPALRAGKIVVCDRSSPSTIAYQHYGRGIVLEKIIEPDQEARQGVNFDLIILLDGDPAQMFARREKETTFEKEGLDFHKRVREGFLAQAGKNPEHWKIFDASCTPEELSRDILGEVKRII